MPKLSRKRCTSGMKVALPATLPSCTDTGQPSASVSSPWLTCSIPLQASRPQLSLASGHVVLSK